MATTSSNLAASCSTTRRRCGRRRRRSCVSRQRRRSSSCTAAAARSTPSCGREATRRRSWTACASPIEAALDAVVAVLAGRTNTTLVAAIGAAGGRAVGLTGADGRIGLSTRTGGLHQRSAARRSISGLVGSARWHGRVAAGRPAVGSATSRSSRASASTREGDAAERQRRHARRAPRGGASAPTG